MLPLYLLQGLVQVIVFRKMVGCVYKLNYLSNEIIYLLVLQGRSNDRFLLKFLYKPNIIYYTS